MSHSGDMLRQRREALGRSVEEVSAQTRIPAQHITAIEEGRMSDLPEGPYAEAWVRTLANHLGVSEATSSDRPSPGGAGPASSLGSARLAGSVALFAMLTAVAWRAWQLGPEVLPGEQPAGNDAPMVRIEARQNVRIQAYSDGELVVDRALPGGETVEVEGNERVVLNLDSVEAVRLEFRGERVLPQGRQRGQRTLVFVDDLAGGDP